MDTTVNDEKKINNEILLDYFNSQNPSLLFKDLYTNDSTKRRQILSMVNDALIDLRNNFSKKNIDRNE